MSGRSRAKTVLAAVFFVLLSLAAGGAGSYLTVSSVHTWYAGLNRPSVSPPNWVFGPVWTALYILMGIAAALVWRQGAGTAVRAAVTAFFAQLALNVLWSFLFFGLRSPLLAFVDILALWAAILATIVLFRRVHPVAWLLMLPYILWVTFAAYLNLRIWQLNR